MIYYFRKEELLYRARSIIYGKNYSIKENYRTGGLLFRTLSIYNFIDRFEYTRHSILKNPSIHKEYL